MNDFERHIPSDHVSVTRDDGDFMRGFADVFNLSLAHGSADQTSGQPSTVSQQSRIDLPDDVGAGWMHHLVLRPGLELWMMDFSLNAPLLMTGRQDPTLIELGFWETGRNVRYRYDFGEGAMEPSQAFLATIPMSYLAQSLFPINERISGVRLSINPAMFQSWLTDTRLPDNLHHALLDNPKEVVSHQQHIPMILTQPLSQLRSGKWQGAMLRLYAEAKMMEIVALYVDHLNRGQGRPQAPLTLDDVDRLYAAKTILLSRLDDPPSLLELAQAVHLNDHKLKIGFKAIFGTTVFGMLYDQRMLKAHELLADRRFNVAEVALQVGYGNPSAFSAAFKRKYGISPRDIRP
ncbi:MAG: AraC family transcriptional regulator [Chloroflexota bacterium]